VCVYMHINTCVCNCIIQYLYFVSLDSDKSWILVKVAVSWFLMVFSWILTLSSIIRFLWRANSIQPTERKGSTFSFLWMKQGKVHSCPLSSWTRMFMEWPCWEGNGPREQAGIAKQPSMSALVTSLENSVAIACLPQIRSLIV
jgi:hypothetical protein